MDIGDKILHSINLLGDLPVFPTRIPLFLLLRLYEYYGQARNLLWSRSATFYNICLDEILSKFTVAEFYLYYL